MSRGKSTKLKPFEKLLTVMVSGKPVSLEEIEATLGKEIHMYRISTYIWHIKTYANGVVGVVKDGRKVTAYQLKNVDTIKEHFRIVGIDPSKFIPGQFDKIVRAKKNVVPVKVNKLADLKAEPQEDVLVDDMEIVEVVNENETVD